MTMSELPHTDIAGFPAANFPMVTTDLMDPLPSGEAPVAFVITRAYIDGVREGAWRTNVRGLQKEGWARLKRVLERVPGNRFRVLDADGYVYFEGKSWVGPDYDGNDEWVPLDAVGEDYGATDLQYWKPGKGGGWPWV
jgi:hypothetical protein